MYILFLILWIILNGRVTVETVLFGLVIAGAVYWFICRFMDYSPRKDLAAFRKLLRGFQYVFLLLWEIMRANIKVMQLILTEKEEVVPELIYFRTDLKSDASRVALANSITLTPGTITVTLEQDEFCVHCLDEEMAEGIEDSSFVHLLHKMEQTPERGEK